MMILIASRSVQFPPHPTDRGAPAAVLDDMYAHMYVYMYIYIYIIYML